MLVEFCCIGLNPVKVGGDSCVYAWVLIVSAAYAIASNTNLDISDEQWATAVSLFKHSTPTIKLLSIDNGN